MPNTVTAVISTKDRYFTTLPGAIMSIAQQTVKVQKLLIFDDGEHKDLREAPLYQYIFSILNHRGIPFEVVFGSREGQVKNHQLSIAIAKTDFIWRMDDDNVAEPTALEELLKAVDKKTGAVGGLVIEPTMVPESKLASNKIEDIYLGMNEQWFHSTEKKGIHEVDHLYSSFIYRIAAAGHGFNKNLSRVGHREETLFTYEMKRAGWKIKIAPKALTWHFRNAEGGIRTAKDPSHWKHDEEVFAQRLKELGVKPTQYPLIVLDNGLGDHYAFKNILPGILKKHPKNLVLATCYPEVFKDDPVIQISIAEAKMLCDIDHYNIYKWMWDNQWKKSIVEAFRKFYAL